MYTGGWWDRVGVAVSVRTGVGRGADGSWVRRQTRFFSSGSLVFFRPAREGKRADFGEGTRAGVARCRRVRTRSGRAGKRTSAIAADPPLTVPSPPALGSGAASAMSPSSQKIPVSADRLMETPDCPRARLFARVNRPPHRPRVRYDDPRVRLSSRRTEWTIRASGEVHRHTTRRPPVLSTRLSLRVFTTPR